MVARDRLLPLGVAACRPRSTSRAPSTPSSPGSRRLAHTCRRFARAREAFARPARGRSRRVLRARRAHFRVVYRRALRSSACRPCATAALLGVGGLLVLEGQGRSDTWRRLIVTSVTGAFAKFGKYLESYSPSRGGGKVWATSSSPAGARLGDRVAPPAGDAVGRPSSSRQRRLQSGPSRRPADVSWRVAPGNGRALRPTARGRAPLLNILWG